MSYARKVTKTGTAGSRCLCGIFPGHIARNQLDMALAPSRSIHPHIKMVLFLVVVLARVTVHLQVVDPFVDCRKMISRYPRVQPSQYRSWLPITAMRSFSNRRHSQMTIHDRPALPSPWNLLPLTIQGSWLLSRLTIVTLEGF